MLFGKRYADGVGSLEGSIEGYVSVVTGTLDDRRVVGGYNLGGLRQRVTARPLNERMSTHL